MISIDKKSVWNALMLLVSVLALIWPAVWNGYPLLYSDSGTYMLSGQIGEVPVDRPITYGLFVRHLSLSWSMWLVVLIQSILVNYLIYQLVRQLLKPKWGMLLHLGIILFLSVLSGLAYYNSMILADIFTSILILSFTLLILLDKKKRLHLVFLSILFIYAIITHLSHLPIILGLLVFVSLYSLLFMKKQWIKWRKRFVLILGLIGFSLVVLSSTNALFDSGFRLSRTSNIMMAGKYFETGVVNKFLQKNCDAGTLDADYADLCEYVGKFDQWPKAGHFLFLEDSPLYAGGCADENWTNCWIEKDEAYGKLVRDILKDGELRTDIAFLVIAGTLKQLIHFEQTELDVANLDWIVEKFYRDDYYSYSHAKQKKEPLTFQGNSFIEAIFVNISFLLMLFFYFKRKQHFSGDIRLFVTIVFSALLINAVVCSTLSTVAARYQGRLIFLLPLLVLILGLAFAKKREKPIQLNLSEII